MRECYVDKNFKPDSLLVIQQANKILANLQAQGYTVTLRQLYYRFVAADLLPNTVRSYKRLGSILGDARLAGLIDWDAIEDRTRFLRENSHWISPASMVLSCARQFAVNKWLTQDEYVEVWVEKDALIGVIEAACVPLDVPCFSCRGYVSLSEIRAAALRLLRHVRLGQHVTVLHLGDHDPSGQDMSRDIADRIDLFGNGGVTDDKIEVRRIALNYDQIEEHAPPPNPAKMTDSRYEGYAARYGHESWELDALEPSVLDELVTSHVLALRDETAWQDAKRVEQAGRDRLTIVADHLREEDKDAG